MIDPAQILVWVVPAKQSRLDEFDRIERSDIRLRYFVIGGSDWASVLHIAKLRGYTHVLRLQATDIVNSNILKNLSSWDAAALPDFCAGRLTPEADSEHHFGCNFFSVNFLQQLLQTPDTVLFHYVEHNPALIQARPSGKFDTSWTRTIVSRASSHP